MDINLKKLEFDKILEILAKFCVTTKGKEITTKLRPSNNYNEVEKTLEETSEAVLLIYKNSEPNFYDFYDINLSIKNLESGNSLSISAILNLNIILKNSFELKKYFDKDYINKDDFPILSNLFDMLYTNKNIIDEIEKCISSEGSIEDDAS